MGEIKAGVTLMQDFCRPRTEKFQEYIDYMDREEAQRNNAITTYNLFNEYMGNPYKSTGLFTAEKDSLSLSTLYSYTERGLLKVKNIDLPEKVGRRVKKKKNRKHKRLHGQSIEKRPESINDKKEFGHWEIDLVIGKKEKTDQVLLTLTERKTKKEIIRKISGKTVNAVHRCLKKLKKETPNFNKIFRSITADNGVEFSKLYEIGEKMGIDIYYAHPYSSWERGLNENTNRIIRRFIPKGHRIREYTKKKIEKVEFWINTMYRRSLGWKTAEECYQNELELLDAVVT